MRWNRWVRFGFAILAPTLFGVMLAAGEWAQEPVSAPPAAAPQAGPTPEHVREVQRALAKAGYDPGPIDGIFGPRTKAALRMYIAVPPPRVSNAVDLVIARFRAGERRESP